MEISNFSDIKDVVTKLYDYSLSLHKRTIKFAFVSNFLIISDVIVTKLHVFLVLKRIL